MFTRMPRAPCRLTSSSSGLRIAASVASRARFGPLAQPVPIIAMPISLITVFTSAKSTLIMPGRLMMSEIPRTAPASTSSALAKADSRLASLPRMVSSFSFGDGDQRVDALGQRADALFGDDHALLAFERERTGDPRQR